MHLLFLILIYVYARSEFTDHDYTCTVELQNTLRVRVKSVYCVAVNTIHNFDIYLFVYLFTGAVSTSY
jgi:hypothetical protein